MSSGRSVSYMPPGDLKSGIPAAQLTPAPVSTTTRWHASLARYAATPWTSREASRIAATRAAPMTSSARMVVALPLSSVLALLLPALYLLALKQKRCKVSVLGRFL